MERETGLKRPLTGALRSATVLLVLAGCGDDGAGPAAPIPAAGDSASGRGEPRSPDPGISSGPLVIFLGDSIAAGMGLPPDRAFPAILRDRAAEEGLPFRLVNAGVSGDTSAGGLARLGWLLDQSPDLVVVELGANDVLRGQPVEAVEANLRRIIERCRALPSRVLLLGMRIPPSYGPEYTEAFADVYPRLAREYDIEFVPFFMENVGGKSELNLPDGIHPNAPGHEALADRVFPALRRVLEEISPARDDTRRAGES